MLASLLSLAATAACPCRRPQDVVIVFDASQKNASSHDASLDTALAALVDELSGSDGTTQIALVAFAGTASTCSLYSDCATTLTGLTSDASTLTNAIGTRDASQGERCTSCGLEMALQLLRDGRAAAGATVLLLTNGAQTVGGDGQKAITKAGLLVANLTDRNASISAVGFLDGVTPGSNDAQLMNVSVAAIGATGSAQMVAAVAQLGVSDLATALLLCDACPPPPPSLPPSPPLPEPPPPGWQDGGYGSPDDLGHLAGALPMFLYCLVLLITSFPRSTRFLKSLQSPPLKFLGGLVSPQPYGCSPALLDPLVLLFGGSIPALIHFNTLSTTNASMHELYHFLAHLFTGVMGGMSLAIRLR